MSGRGYTAWCHFNFDAAAAPGWLKKLSDEAKLAKDNVSLSFLQVSAKGRKPAGSQGKSLVRAVSGPFELPPSGDMADGTRRYGQYACSERGLTLLSLPRKHLLPLPGTLLEAAWPDFPEKDAKSGALVLPLGQIPGLEAPAPAPAAQTPEAATPAAPAKKAPRLPSERPLERPKSRPKPRAPKPTPQPAPPPAPPATPAVGQLAEARAGKRPDKSPGKPAAKPAGKSAAPPLASLDELFAEDAAQEAARKPARRPGKKKPGQPAVKKTSKPKAKKGGKSAPKANSRAARKAKKA